MSWLDRDDLRFRSHPRRAGIVSHAQLNAEPFAAMVFQWKKALAREVFQTGVGRSTI
jgi:hypothetical protein